MTVKYDRVLLEAIVDKYLEALVAHNPAGLPLSKKTKYTENAQVIPVGEALWLTASEKPTYKLYVSDPQAGQVGFFGLMKENGSPIILSARLKTEKGQITEIETVVVRADARPFPLENLVKPKQTYLESIPPEERISRKELIRISDLYFDALVQDNGDIAPFDDRCTRIENGTQTTSNPNASLPGSSFNPLALGCREQINSRMFAYITEINPRRWTVVDEERGLTFGTFMFHHTGRIKSVNVPGRGEVEMIPAARRPFTVVVIELFKVQNGKIRDIEVNMTAVPYRAGSGWED